MSLVGLSRMGFIRTSGATPAASACTTWARPISSPSRGDEGVEGHVLGFEGGHPVAVLAEDPAQPRRQQALARVGGGALNHDRFCHHSDLPQRRSSSRRFLLSSRVPHARPGTSLVSSPVVVGAGADQHAPRRAAAPSGRTRPGRGRAGSWPGRAPPSSPSSARPVRSAGRSTARRAARACSGQSGLAPGPPRPPPGRGRTRSRAGRTGAIRSSSAASAHEAVAQPQARHGVALGEGPQQKQVGVLLQIRPASPGPARRSAPENTRPPPAGSPSPGTAPAISSSSRAGSIGRPVGLLGLQRNTRSRPGVDVPAECRSVSVKSVSFRRQVATLHRAAHGGQGLLVLGEGGGGDQGPPGPQRQHQPEDQVRRPVAAEHLLRRHAVPAGQWPARKCRGTGGRGSGRRRPPPPPAACRTRLAACPGG